MTIIPTHRLLWLFAAPLALSALAVVWPQQQTWLWGVDGALVLIAIVDATSLPRRGQVQLERKAPAHTSVGAKNSFAIELDNRSQRKLRFELVESFPATIEVRGLPAAGWLEPRARHLLRYFAVPHRRGQYRLGRTYLRVDSRFGLWRRQFRPLLPQALKVLPNVKNLGKYALLARRNRLDLMGLRTQRGRGTDAEFERLRDYQRDDDYRRIDPRASARHQRLISREYSTNRDQNVFFVVDCGRPMAGESSGLSNLDHALNAALMLGVIALDQGDNIGLLAFDSELRALLPLRSGLRSKQQLLHTIYDLRVSRSEPSYRLAFEVLQRRVRQRALVVLLTNVTDEAGYRQLLGPLEALRARHLPLVVLLRDADLFGLADREPQSLSELYTIGAAAELALWREQLAARIRRLGALVLDITPEEATPRLINGYLRVKADHLL